MNATNSKMMALAFAVFSAATALAFNQSMYPYELPAGKKGAGLGCTEAKLGMELELGKWYTNFQVCKKYADEKGIPLVAVWSNEKCIHCWYTDVCFIQQEFLDWKKTHDAGKVIYCFMAGGYGGYDQVNSDAYNWMWYGGGTRLNAYPFVVLWWEKGGVNERYTGDNFCDTLDLMDRSIPGRVTTVIGRLEKAFAKWSPVPDYAGGTFTDPDTEGDRLEFEDATATVTVGLAREESLKSVMTNVTLVVKSPVGAELASQKVAWAAGWTNTTAEITLSAAMKAACTKDGQQLTLYLRDGGKDWSTNHITYVDREASAANPLWLGESFGFGEWTCDYVAATQKVAKSGAYTLVSIQGSKWCPDCANTDRNFLEVTDKGTGANRFRAWAKSKNIALVAMDIPNYNGPTVADCATPTIFSKNAYSTRLARPNEYPQSGAEAALTNYTTRSGLGYLTRKGATDAKAAEVMARFHDLASTNTDKGGFHRPEDGNKNRTGVPIFVLLDKKGKVVARFTRFAAVSPMAADKANFDNYIKRFEEMLAIAATSGAHADTTEIENNYPGAGAIPFVANGGTASGELCNADFQDAFKLTGVGGNAAQKVTVKGVSETEVSVQFWQKNADGSFSAVGTASHGRLCDGVGNTYTFTEAGDYYLLVKGYDITSAGFAAASATANNFQSFTVTGSTVLVPQGDQVSAHAPAGSKKVTIRLETDKTYCFSGVDAEASADVLDEKGTMGAYTFFTAKSAGDLEITLKSEGGEIWYQVWQPGKVAFVETARAVPESINDLNDDWVEFLVARTEGKSGRVKARVTIDSKKTTMEADRYVFATNAPGEAVDFVWEDGVESNMTVRVKIDDNMLFDGDADIVFNLNVLSSDNGDVTVADNRGVFTLKVIEDDKAEPGRGLITRTTPAAASRNTVYARESEGALVWVERIEAFDGLVAAELVSSLAGTEYATENPRDLTNDLGRTCIYWSSRESAEKWVRVTGIPAGRSAHIQLKSFMDFKTVSGSNTVTVVAVADDAPAFAKDTSSFPLYRYMEPGTAEVAVDQTTLKGGKVSFTKVSGTLPAGLKAAYDSTKVALVFTGVTTAKPGTYETVYQVVETRNNKRVPGLTTVVTFVVTDPTDLKTNPEGANPAVAKARTFKDLVVINPVNKRMTGVLQLTIPTKGNASGKYVCESGTISLSAKRWGDFNPKTKALSTLLTNARTGIAVGLTANEDGSVDVVVEDPMYPAKEGYSLDAFTDGKQWSAANSATNWLGYYTVALPVEKVVTNAIDKLAPTGTGYLTLSFTSKSAWNSGTVKWAGLLPNGTAVSGSSVLGSIYKAYPEVDKENMTDWVNLPVFKWSSTDTLSVYVRIQRDAAKIRDTDRRSVLSVADVISCWDHGKERGTRGKSDYLVDLGVYGGIYDKTEDLGGCCQEYYQTNEMLLWFDVSELGKTYYGAPKAVDPLSVIVTEDTITVEAGQQNPANVKLAFNRSTGVVSGSLVLDCPDKDISASYRGIVLTGWGEGCGCGPTAGLTVMPFVNGSFYFSDKVVWPSNKTTTEKRGGAAMVDAVVQAE